jgi:biofilm protein TabA
MILDRLSAAERYFALHPGFPQAFTFLRQADFAALEPGKHEIDGKRLYVLVNHDQGRGRQGARLESHRKYIDIQFVVAGADLMGWRALAETDEVDMPYDADRDVGFFKGPPVTWLDVRSQSFTIFYPEDVHAPLGCEGQVHKAVVKVAVEW